jgi:hypothetical protein
MNRVMLDFWINSVDGSHNGFFIKGLWWCIWQKLASELKILQARPMRAPKMDDFYIKTLSHLAGEVGMEASYFCY